MSIKRDIGTISTTTWSSEVFPTDNAYDGYCVMVGGTNVTPTVNAHVYESLGGVANEDPQNSNAFEWAEVGTGTATATEAFILNRESFRGSYIYVKVDASAGTLTNGIMRFKQK